MKLVDLRARKDEDRLFELSIREKVHAGVELNDEELYALELFDKLKSGEELTDVEKDDLDLLLGRTCPAAMPSLSVAGCTDEEVGTNMADDDLLRTD